MIKVKHLLEAIGAEDGARMWVEPVGLTKDLQAWCAVDHLMSHLGPPRALADWFDEHPDGYDFFRGKYHEHLSAGQYRPVLQRLAQVAVKDPITLLHTGDDDEHNAATALHEFIAELSSYCPPET